MVLKAAPPLMVTEEQIDSFVTAVTTVLDQVHSSPAFWSEALGMARRAMDV
jgi:acetylornithine/succinyldiaminopimelate/putrescine aminotransferase